MTSKFAWIEINYQDDIDISEFLSHDGTLDKDAMQNTVLMEESIQNPTFEDLPLFRDSAYDKRIPN